MIRINIVVEGHSEEEFVCRILGEYLAQAGIYVCARRVKTGRKSGRDYRGGVTTYAKIKNDILRWLAQDSTAYLSTFQ
jgi:CRISPR/Cas system-associated protein Csm6